jgi:Arc/MetJ-type ribon-helix-helix transcriptional regulator
VETISLKITSEQARLLERATEEAALPSKSEFVRYAIARALEEKLSVQTIQEVFEGRRQIRQGKVVPMRKLKSEG